ncbi:MULTISPECIES: hypothetical protein [unclassified Pseudomonas]|uniref:hypothetical protein n=1 Tax=unclassified Pseudomonas TaxID=196821 RepID=UPI000B87DE1E|nr:MULTISPECIES: hypothetical protein [unclassified Pseudomonas]
MGKAFVHLATPLILSFLATSSALCHAEDPTIKAVEAKSLDNFQAPDTVLRTGPEAQVYCKGLSDKARLPTVVELQTLFTSKTRSPVSFPDPEVVQNDDMCTVHGWPMSHQCGGNKGFYWASDRAVPEKYYAVGMSSGYYLWPATDYTALVACTTDK